MQITDVRVKKIPTKNRMKAVASITFDNEFVIHDIKVIEKVDENVTGLFIAMPSRKNPVTGEFRDIAHPINADTRKKIEDAIFEAYNNAEDVEEKPAE